MLVKYYPKVSSDNGELYKRSTFISPICENYSYSELENNVKPLEKVFVDVMLYFSRRGRETCMNSR